MTVASFFDSMSYAAVSEGDADARAFLEARGGVLGLVIDGTSAPAADGATFETLEPGTGRVLCRLAKAGADDVERAAAAATKAQPAWLALGGHGRARHLYALARAVQRHAHVVAVMESLDAGLLIRETREIVVPEVVRTFYHGAGSAGTGDTVLAGFEPVGVVAVVAPFAMPLLTLVRQMVPALAAGNTVVVKPDALTPVSALLLADLAAHAGLPPGVFNVLTGGEDLVDLLAGRDGVGGVNFAGDGETGRRLRAALAGSGKALSLQLSGRTPLIVFEDADLDSAIEGVVDAVWTAAGQARDAGGLLLVQEGVAEDFLARLKRRMGTLRIGHALERTVDIGPLVSAEHAADVAARIAVTVAAGADLFQLETVLPEGEGFLPPTLLTGYPADFGDGPAPLGPVVMATTFRTPDDAVALAGNSRYGLAAALFTETIGRALDVAAKLDAGTVWVNAVGLQDAAVPAAGRKEAGPGVLGGDAALFGFVRPTRRPTPRKAGAEASASSLRAPAAPLIDRTPKLYIGGKLVRPDGGASRAVLSSAGAVLGEVGEGGRKDIRNAVTAARAAGSWAAASGHARAQVLYFLAENLAARGEDFAARIAQATGDTSAVARGEVDAAVERLFLHAALADRDAGAVLGAPLKGLVYTLNEALGVVGVIAPDEAPLLSLVSLIAPLIAAGNRVVAVPGERVALVATDLVDVIGVSDVPAGVFNLVTGPAEGLAKALAEHDDVDGLWAFAGETVVAVAERHALGNLKPVFSPGAAVIDWFDPMVAAGPQVLAAAHRVKAVWVPAGE